ncbi:MAG: ribonuclease activity regulator RraA [Trueperaceae bacterium]|nr:ribonuclease activity regulator RraA [Trueperaceae bacterium]
MPERTAIDLSPLGAELAGALAQVSSATLATQLYKRGFRTRAVRGAQRLRPGVRMVGVARTLRYVAAREDLDTLAEWVLDTNPQRAIADEIEVGQVLVIEAREERSCGTMGGMLVARLMVRGAAGIVSDGPFRDAPFIADLDFPSYAAGMHANTNLVAHHPEELDRTITCGGVQVRPGDVIVGDDEGAIVIPRYLAAEIAPAALEQEREEAFIEARVLAGAPVRGTYPMSAEVRAEYERESGRARDELQARRSVS